MGEINFNFNYFQLRRFNERKNRTFLPMCSQSELIKKIKECSDVGKLELLAIRYDLCDHCDFKHINLITASILINVTVTVLYKYPKLRSKICFIGSKAGYLQSLTKLAQLDADAIKKFKLREICADEQILQLSREGIEMIESSIYNDQRENLLAQTFDMCGLLDGIVLDESDFRGLGYARLCKQLIENEAKRYHPNGCSDVKSVIYHEFGHLLDYLCEINKQVEFVRYYKSFTKEQIAKNLSQYASTNAQEFFAEAFSEYMCSFRPSEIAANIGKLLDKYYKIKFGG